MKEKVSEPRLATARQNIRLAIALRDTTATEVSRAAGLSINALGSFLRGDTSIRYENLLKVCDALRIPIGILHVSGAITPARLELQSALDDLSQDQLAAVMTELSQRPN